MKTINQPLDLLDPSDLQAVFDAQADEGRRLIEAEPVAIRETRVLYSVDMQFVGQTHLLRVALDSPNVTSDALQEKFEAAYFKRFRVELSEGRANVVNANCSVIGVRDDLDLSSLIDPAGRKQTLSMAQTGSRTVMFDQGQIDTPIYWRDHLPLDFTLVGPAIIEQLDTTVLIEPENTATGDAVGNIIITIGDGS